jgi:hypothetical protein
MDESLHSCRLQPAQFLEGSSAALQPHWAVRGEFLSSLVIYWLVRGIL